MIDNQNQKNQNQKKDVLFHIKEFRVLYFMLIPAIVYYIIFCYIPMGGILMAFQDFSFRRGICILSLSLQATTFPAFSETRLS